MSEIEAQIKQYVVDNFVFGGDPDEITPETSFMENGIIDSLGVLTLISFVEETWGIVVADEDVIPENFDSVRSLTNYVSSKLSTSVVVPS